MTIVRRRNSKRAIRLNNFEVSPWPKTIKTFGTRLGFNESWKLLTQIIYFGKRRRSLRTKGERVESVQSLLIPPILSKTGRHRNRRELQEYIKIHAPGFIQFTKNISSHFIRRYSKCRKCFGDDIIQYSVSCSGANLINQKCIAELNPMKSY